MSVGLGENFARKMPAGTPALLGIASIICLLIVSGFGLRRAASPADRVVRFQISFPSSLRAALPQACPPGRSFPPDMRIQKSDPPIRPWSAGLSMAAKAVGWSTSNRHGIVSAS